MYDSEIRDIMNRKKTPKFELNFEIEHYTYGGKPMFPTLLFPINQEESEC